MNIFESAVGHNYDLVSGLRLRRNMLNNLFGRIEGQCIAASHPNTFRDSSR